MHLHMTYHMPDALHTTPLRRPTPADQAKADVSAEGGESVPVHLLDLEAQPSFSGVAVTHDGHGAPDAWRVTQREL